MPTPFDSSAPTPISPSEPWWSGGLGALVRGTRQIASWILGLSPANAAVYDTGWLPLTVDGANWVTFGSASFMAPAVRRIGVVVYLRGMVKTSVAISGSSSPILTLPEGFRPSSTDIQGGNSGGMMRTSGAASTGTAHTHTNSMQNMDVRIQISPAGTVTYYPGLSTDSTSSGQYVSLSGILFTVDA